MSVTAVSLAADLPSTPGGLGSHAHGRHVPELRERPPPEHVSEAFPEATLERLRAIKSAWDPDDVFNQNFDVAVVTK